MTEQTKTRQDRYPSLGMREVLRLTKLETAPYRLLSLYIDTDGQAPEPATIRSRAHSLLHQARAELEAGWSAMEHDVRESAREDLERCRTFMDKFVPHGACRGLALFACAGRDVWHRFPLPRPVSSRYAWGTHPLILPTLHLLEDYPRTAVILLDREHGRFFGSRMGEIEELSTMREDVPRRVSVGGWYGLAEHRIERHIDEHVRGHLKHVAAAAQKVFQSWPATWLLVGGNTELLEDFRHCLHLSLRERWAKDLPVAAGASLTQIQEAVIAAEQELQEQREVALLTQLYAESRAGGYGVVGVPETLQALYLGEVDTLVVDAELRMTGYRCETCSTLSESQDRCDRCGAESAGVCPDLVDAAIAEAFAHGGGAEVVGTHADLRADGGMGALLRFRPRG